MAVGEAAVSLTGFKPEDDSLGAAGVGVLVATSVLVPVAAGALTGDGVGAGVATTDVVTAEVEVVDVAAVGVSDLVEAVFAFVFFPWVFAAAVALPAPEVDPRTITKKNSTIDRRTGFWL
jgi:hypothetical protein